MLKSEEQTTQVHDLSRLHPGEIVQVRLPGTLLIYEGEVETLAPQHGVLWIRHGGLQERKLIVAGEYDIFTRHAHTPALPAPAAPHLAEPSPQRSRE